MKTKTLASILYQVPNQPVHFVSDKEHLTRSEDDIIACKLLRFCASLLFSYPKAFPIVDMKSLFLQRSDYPSKMCSTWTHNFHLALNLPINNGCWQRSGPKRTWVDKATWLVCIKLMGFLTPLQTHGGTSSRTLEEWSGLPIYRWQRQQSGQWILSKPILLNILT